MPAGIAEASLRRALHDARGPLNALSVMLEILRAREVTTAAGRELLDKAAQCVRGLGNMLERIGRASSTLASPRTAVPLLESLEAAVARGASRTTCTLHAPSCEPEDAAVLGSAESLSALLDTLLDCVSAAMPAGGAITLRASATADSCVVRAVCDGATVTLPTAFARPKLDGALPGPADWFRLSCQVEGLAGVFVADQDGEPGTIGISVPRAIRG